MLFLTTNRIDNPVEDFAQNGAIMNSITEPHSAVYLTQAIRLEQPATSIKLMFLEIDLRELILEHCIRYSERWSDKSRI